jgi:hypothetical protein
MLSNNTNNSKQLRRLFQRTSPQGAQRAAWGRSPAPGGGPESRNGFPESGRVLGPLRWPVKHRLTVRVEAKNAPLLPLQNIFPAGTPTDCWSFPAMTNQGANNGRPQPDHN